MASDAPPQAERPPFHGERRSSEKVSASATSIKAEAARK